MSSFSPNQLRQCARFTGTPCTPDKEQQLREQIHSELAKIKYCANPTYECSLMRIEGYDYCIRHILRDPRSNYRQCSHVYSNGRKCINAVPKYDNKKEQILTTLCFEHNRQTQLQKTHLNVGRIRSRVETNETLLHSLSSHINVEDIKPEIPKTEPDDDEIDVVSPHVTPFVTQDHRNSIGHVVESSRKRRRILDYASDSSSNDEDPPCLRNTAQDIEFYESDYESIDSEDDDPLKHAGVYTRAEAVRIAETKLIKLQGLYREQISHLQHILKQRRRKYLHEIRRERELYCSIHDQLKETPHERKLYEQLKALNSYHRRQGMEAVLYKKLKEKRARDTLYASKSSNPKCVFTEGGVKCGERTLPCCKHCRKHILEDKRQVLFRACGVERSGVVCQEPVASILEDSSCVLHLTVAPAKRQYIQKFYEVPSTPSEESIFAAGRGADNFVGEDPRNEMHAEGDDLLDFASGIFEFDLDTADDLANSLDDECSMFLDMDSGDLGLAIDDDSVDDAHLDLGLEEEGDGGSNDFVDHAETQAQDNLIEGHLDLEESSSVQDSSEFNFEIGEADSNVNEVLRMLEGIEQMPWFDALMN
ncbi:KAT8 regulatory NSL complex subunit 2 isoform X1 [Drosophila subpulchrella]|uniref:KAT8 regulatory NSL complex subunit 2 isoform X1 n=1 Tax=Drosophila subpulchrella TaxID=1486046 RepID=UPI0018A14E79|nr:KAT8 regulatory NSL complex subunit 2 isoform X1 [Drosophila subpulchrella]